MLILIAGGTFAFFVTLYWLMFDENLPWNDPEEKKRRYKECQYNIVRLELDMELPWAQETLQEYLNDRSSLT